MPGRRKLIPILVDFALPTITHFAALWLGRPDWDLPMLVSFLAGCFVTVLYLLPSTSRLDKANKSLQRIERIDKILTRLDEEGWNKGVDDLRKRLH